jgi:hypothetical protein
MINKIFEGKTPAERNKTIAALVLGFLAVAALSYTFLFGGSSKKTTAAKSNTNSNSAVRAGLPQTTETPAIQSPEKERQDNPFEALTPLPDDPFGPAFADAPSRNIFVLYDPSQNPPVQKPSPIPSPSPPPPPPPIYVGGVNPSSKYSGEKDFTLEVYGDKFTPDSKILFQGMELPTQYGGAQRLSAQISSSLITGEGQRQITVRTPDGKLYSNVAILTVQAPPVPNFNFVGLVARKRYNNDMAVLQDKTNKQQFQNVRLGETVGRFKVVSISSKELVMQDVQLSFRHNLPFVDERTANRTGGSSPAATSRPTGGNSYEGFGNVQFQTIQPGQQIPGIPQQYTQQPPPQMPQPNAMPQPPQPQQKDEKGDEDEDN